MGRKRHSAKEIVNKSRQADVELAKGSTMTGVCKPMAVSEHTSCAWRHEYGGLKADQTRRSKELEQENARLKRFLAEAGLDKVILREPPSPNEFSRRARASRSSEAQRLAK